MVVTAAIAAGARVLLAAGAAPRTAGAMAESPSPNTAQPARLPAAVGAVMANALPAAVINPAACTTRALPTWAIRRSLARRPRARVRVKTVKAVAASAGGAW